MSDSLAKTGWRLRPDWNPCASTSGKSAKDVNALALNTDLKDSGEAYISDILSQGSGTGFLDVGADGAVLQVTKIRNIAAPKSNEDSGVAPRMLKLILTDGHSNLQALEIERLDKISLNTPPGTKVRLKSVPSKIVVKSGFALIQAKNLELLGGKVEPLIEKWEISQKLAQFTRAQNTGAEGEPPPWVPFGKNIGQAVDRGFKALAGDTKDEAGKDDSGDFESQRKDAIEEAAKQGGKKVFGGGNKEIKEGSRKKREFQSKENTPDDDKLKPDHRQPNPSSEPPVIDEYEDRRGGPRGGRGRGGGRRGGGTRGGARDRDEDENDGEGSYGQPRPTQGVSLFDFLEEKFPGAHDVPEKTQKQQGRDYQNPQDAHRSKGKNDNRQDYKDRENGSVKQNDFSKGRKDGKRGGGREVRNQRGDQRQDRGGPQNRRRGGDDIKRLSNRPENSHSENHSGKVDRSQHVSQYKERQEDNSLEPNRWSQARDNNERRQHQQQHQSSGGHSQYNEQQHRSSGVNSNNAGGRNVHQRREGDVQSDRDFGEWSNSTYHDSQKPRPGDRKSNRQHHQRHQHQQYDNDKDLPQSFNNMTLNKASERMNHSQKHSTTGRNGNSGSHGARNGAQASKWVVGDACLAKYWEDGNFYDAQITALSKTTAVVFFPEYGNHEEVMLTDIMNVPFSGQGINSSRSSKRSGDSRFIPATPGLPPAFKQSTT